MQCGADPNLRNRRGLTPLDLAKSDQMARILKVAPIQEIKKSVARFEGPVIRVSIAFFFSNFISLSYGGTSDCQGRMHNLSYSSIDIAEEAIPQDATCLGRRWSRRALIVPQQSWRIDRNAEKTIPLPQRRCYRGRSWRRMLVHSGQCR